MKRIVPSLPLLILLVAFPLLSETIYVPSLPDIATSLHTSDNAVQATLSIYFIGFALGVFFWGTLSDRIGRRPAMLWGILIYGMGSLCCFLSGSIELLLISRFVQAFGASTGSVVTQTILRESIDGNKRHAVFADISAAMAFIPALGPLLGGWIDQLYGFKVVLFSLIIVAVGTYFYTFSSLPETKLTSTTLKISIFSVLKRLVLEPRVLAFNFLIAGMNGLIFSYYAESPFIFMEYFKILPGNYGSLGVIVALGSIVGALLSKRLLTINSAEKIVFKGCSIILVASLLLSCIVMIETVPSILYMGWFLLAIFILFVGIGLAIPCCFSLALANFHDVLGTASALFGMGYYFAISVMTWGMSFLHNDSLLTMPLYFVFISIMMTIVCRKYIL